MVISLWQKCSVTGLSLVFSRTLARLSIAGKPQGRGGLDREHSTEGPITLT